MAPDEFSTNKKFVRLGVWFTRKHLNHAKNLTANEVSGQIFQPVKNSSVLCELA